MTDHVERLRHRALARIASRAKNAKADAALDNEVAARLERLREALEAIIARSHNDPLGTSKVIDMRRIAERALTTGAAHVRVD